MGDCSQEVIAQEVEEIESVKKSEMCIGWNSANLANDLVTGVTTQYATLEKTQLVTNSTLKMTQGKNYVSCLHDITNVGAELIEQHDHTWHIVTFYIIKQSTKLVAHSMIHTPIYTYTLLIQCSYLHIVYHYCRYEYLEQLKM